MPIQGVLSSDDAAVLAGAAISARAANYIQVIMDFSQTAWKTTGNHIVLSVTGLVRLRIWCTVEQAFVSSYRSVAFKLGGEGVLPDTSTTGLTAGLMFCNLTDPVDHLPTFSVIGSNNGLIQDWCSDGQPLIAVVSEGEDPGGFTSGKLAISCVWEPMTPGATVTAGDGSAPS